MAALGVDKSMLRELESMGFPTGRATRALYYSGNSSVEDAINWVLEHEDDSDIDQIPQVPIDIKIESGEPLHSEDVKMKLKDLWEQAQKRREEEEKRMERELEKERIRRGKRLMEDKRSEEKNERQRIIAFRKAEKEEEKRARQKIRQQLELDKAERRRRLGLPAESPGTVKSTPLPIQEGNVGSKPVIPSLEEPLKDCLRSLKKNHKDDDAKVKKAFQTLLVYVANVVRNPDNEKYRKIRLTNPLFQDRVGKFKQGIEFLELCGFHKLEGNEFLYMPRNKVDLKVLNAAGLALNSALTNPFFGMLSL